MMPLVRGREKSVSAVFFTVPVVVAMKMNLSASNSRTGRMALMRSPSSSGSRLTIGLPRAWRLACGKL